MKSFSEILSVINDKEHANMIVIEGVVGVGKSSLMRHISKLGYETFEEPVFDNPILEKFYYDRKRYSFPLQIFFLNKRFQHIKEASKIDKAILDRSIYGDAIFAKLLHLNDEMEDVEYETYEELLENMLQHVVPPKLMIYLEVSVDEAIRRIRKRGLDFEQVVEREYWQNLNDQYTSFFNQYKISPILRINVDNLDFENRPEDLEYVLSLISSKLEELDVRDSQTD